MVWKKVWWWWPFLPAAFGCMTRNACQASVLMNSTWAQLLLSLSETLSVHRNSCCLISFSFSTTNLETYFLVWITTQVYLHFESLTVFKQLELQPAWKITTAKANSLVALQSAVLSETFGALQDCSGLWPAISLWVGCLSELTNFQVWTQLLLLELALLLSPKFTTHLSDALLYSGFPGAFIPNASTSNSNTNASGIWPHIMVRLLRAKWWLTCLSPSTAKTSPMVINYNQIFAFFDTHVERY